MAATVTHWGAEQVYIGRDPVQLVFEVAPAIGDASEDIVLRAMPDDVTYLWAQIQTITAEAGATSSVLGLKHGTTAIFTGSADNGGTLNTIDIGDASSGVFLPATADTAGATQGNLVAATTIVGTTTTAPKWRVIVCCMRKNVPT